MEDKLFKKCIKCNETKILCISIFRFMYNTNKFNNSCRKCEYEYKRNRDKIPEINQKRREYNQKYRETHVEECKNYSTWKYYNNIEQTRLNSKLKMREYRKKKRKLLGLNESYKSPQEKIIENFLIENNIKYECEKQFNNCKSPKNNNLSFDFYIPDYNLIIEYDGIHHFKPIFGEEKYEIIKLHDKIKNEYCVNNNIYIYRISEKQNIIDYLKGIF